MTATLSILRGGPLMTVQDMGRPGRMAVGLSPGGAMDRLALLEGAALMGLPQPVAAIEMAGLGGSFRVDAPVRFALTGAPMTARRDDTALRWHASHVLQPDQTLTLGGAQAGTYGYLTPASGIAEDCLLGSAAAHLSAGLGRLLQAGDVVALGTDPAPDRPPQVLTADARFSGGTLRLMPGPQTALFDDDTLARLAATPFHRSARANRTGLPLTSDGLGFATRATASPISDFIVAGDLQITGDGSPFLMLAECQTIGGYPRIGTVIAADLPRAAQAAPTDPLRFAWLTTEAADTLFQTDAQVLAALRGRVHPQVRDPADVPDLLSHQLIGGVTAGRDEET
ncbi:biotin-dependent carboxyltransferase family protein [Loktanella sp. DJP18]|uniref:5-oxoprolinase subunit C family protein n=1 Tax=Loktanella sp. DJP18 TaxID=3409788 RepID=UPI003BB4A58A